MIELFEDNKTAYEAVCEQLADTGKACVIHPTVPASLLLRSNGFMSFGMGGLRGQPPKTGSPSKNMLRKTLYRNKAAVINVDTVQQRVSPDTSNVRKVGHQRGACLPVEPFYR